MRNRCRRELGLVGLSNMAQEIIGFSGDGHEGCGESYSVLALVGQLNEEYDGQVQLGKNLLNYPTVTLHWIRTLFSHTKLYLPYTDH
jgi:hypothetical protein